MKIKTHQRRVEEILKKGGIAVIPTDTIYGLVGQALNRSSVKKIYKLKERKPDKPLIILISNIKQLKQFNIDTDRQTQLLLNRFWPGKVSIILPCSRFDLKYLHRGTGTLAFRLPDYQKLNNLIKQTGPLVAPSANPEGEEPAKTIEEARQYFGDRIEFYEDAGQIDFPPSTLISITNGKIKVLREGAVKIKT